MSTMPFEPLETLLSKITSVLGSSKTHLYLFELQEVQVALSELECYLDAFQQVMEDWQSLNHELISAKDFRIAVIAQLQSSRFTLDLVGGDSTISVIRMNADSYRSEAPIGLHMQEITVMQAHQNLMVVFEFYRDNDRLTFIDAAEIGVNVTKIVSLISYKLAHVIYLLSNAIEILDTNWDEPYVYINLVSNVESIKTQAYDALYVLVRMV